MINDYITNRISSLIPNLSYEVPFLGVVDFTNILSALVIFIALTLLFWIIRRVVLIRLRMIAKRTDTEADDIMIAAVQHIHVAVYTIAALYISLQVFEIGGTSGRALDAVFYVALTWQVIRILSGLIKYFAEARLQENENGEVDVSAAAAADMVTLIARVALWVLGGLFVLSNLGIEVTSLVAGLGIGGIAVAFALQGILSDLFASFSLYFDKPFRIGDHIVIGTDAGIVEKIGIKTTRIRTLQGEELVVSNAELTTTRVQNFKKMKNRRGTIELGVTYETPLNKLEQIKGVVAEIFESIELAELDRVFFVNFGASALEFQIVYHVDSSEYKDFLVAQEQFNFALLKKFNELGIEFAYPTQVVYTKVS